MTYGLATARSRQLALRRFSAWLAEEGETDRDELLGLKPPKLDSKVVERWATGPSSPASAGFPPAPAPAHRRRVVARRRATSKRRAADEARRLNLGEL